MLSSRKERNITQQDLDFIEKSGSLEDFTGFFKDAKVKALFELVLDHLVYCVKRRAMGQKDAEILLSQCVLNFKASPSEANLIKSFVADRVKQALGLAETPRISEPSSDSKQEKAKPAVKKDESLTANATEFSQQQSKLRQSSKKRAKPQGGAQQKASEFDEDEFIDI